jgi:hypothetical protein
MHKYEVTWLLNDGNKLMETFEADLYSVEQNGLAVFLIIPKVTNLQFTANPAGEGPPQRQAEAVGTVGGYNMIKRVS